MTSTPTQIASQVKLAPTGVDGSTAFVPSVVGLIIAGEVIKDLTKDVIVKAEE